jgi:RNA polymerase sigma factor (sigma-70 family)
MMKDPEPVTRDSRPPLLSTRDERKLAERIKAGDQLAREQLILANRRLVFRIVRPYKLPGISLDDLIQEGSVGLIRAAQNFDPGAHAIRFSTYAAFWIRAFIQRAIHNDSSLVRLPKHTRRMRDRYLRVAREIKTRGIDELKPAGQESPGVVPGGRYLGLALEQTDRERQGSEDQDLCNFQEGPFARFQTPENELSKQEDRAVLHAALRRLNPFEAWVIRERFGLFDSDAVAIESSKLRKKARSKPRAKVARKRQASLGAKAVQVGSTYYWRTHQKLSHDCGLSVYRLRLVEQTALDKLRSVLMSPAVAHALSPRD